MPENRRAAGFSRVVTPSFQDPPVRQLTDEVHPPEARLEQEQAKAVAKEKYEVSEDLRKLPGSTKDPRVEAMLLTAPDALRRPDSQYWSSELVPVDVFGSSFRASSSLFT